MDKTVIKALRVLEALSASELPRGVSELAEQLAMTKANAHRLLRTLVSAGYVLQDDQTGRYRLSLRMWEIGVAPLGQLDLIEVVRPKLRELSDIADESVQLAVLQQDHVVYIDKADSRHPLRAITQIGGRVPAHCVSTGKVLLAASQEPLRHLRFPLKRYTARTICGRDQLAMEMTAIKRQGYSVNRGEWRDGIWGVAAPIFDASGAPVAALSVWGPELRFRGAALPRLTGHVLTKSGAISALLGHRDGKRATRSSVR